MKRRVLGIALVAASCLGGCGTLIDAGHTGGGSTWKKTPGPHVYGGSRFDVHLLENSNPKGVLGAIFVFGCVVDIPLSFALDTALLPISLLRQRWNRSSRIRRVWP